MADNVVAFTGEDFVIFAADTAQGRSVVMMKNDEDKLFEMRNKIIGASGPAGDKSQFCSYIEKNINLYRYRTGIELSTTGAANFLREELATALRSNPYQVNILLGGLDKDTPALYMIEYLASMVKVDYGCIGYAGYFLLSILDREYKKGMKLEEARQLMHVCIQELKTRLALNTCNFIIKVVDKNGTRFLEKVGNVGQKNH
jgi:20S proteasome subunit beta 4